MSRGSGQAPESSKDREQSAGSSLLELVSVVAVAVIAALLIQAFLVKPYRIPSRSMVPTLTIGQRILVNRIEGRFGTPERGEIAVFMPPSGTEMPECGVTSGQHFAAGQVYRDGDEPYAQEKMPCPIPAEGKYDEAYVKRVVGMPGDTISVKRGRVWVNGAQLPEPYLPDDDDCRNNDELSTDCNFPTPIKVPAGHYFMMGDNRNDGESFDSRFWGPVAASSVVGEVFFTYWPPRKIGTP